MLEMNQVYNMDNVEGMKDISDKFFDLAIVDPPYGISVTSMNMGGRKTVKPNKELSWDNSIPNSTYFDELFRISKNQIIWGGIISIYRLHDVLLYGIKANQCMTEVLLSVSLRGLHLIKVQKCIN